MVFLLQYQRIKIQILTNLKSVIILITCPILLNSQEKINRQYKLLNYLDKPDWWRENHYKVITHCRI